MHNTNSLDTDKTKMLQATVHGWSLVIAYWHKVLGLKQINVRPSNKQTVALEHLFKIIIIVTIIVQKDIRLNYYPSWPRRCCG